MNIDLKQKALKKLAQLGTETANTALLKEADKIASVLKATTRYDELEGQLELLDTIAYRVHAKALEMVREFLDRLSTLQLTYNEVWGYTADRLKEYQNNYSLTAKALKVLEHIRYHEPDAILDIFFSYSIHPNEDVAKQALHGLGEFTKLDLDIFWGDGKDWPGLGSEPQEKAIAKIESFNTQLRKQYFEAILLVCNNVLSPEIEGAIWRSDSVTLQRGAIAAVDTVPQTRDRTISILESIYQDADTIEKKKSVINSLLTATRTPHAGRYDASTAQMIAEDTIAVLRFLSKLVEKEDLQIVQKIEHDAYWAHYHRANEGIRPAALEIKAKLDQNSEYQIFKILIGFEGIFGEWDIKAPENKSQQVIKDDIDQETEIRERKALEFAQSITPANYAEWERRIVSYASIESNDLATFPYFGKFLEHFGQASPTLSLRLLVEQLAPKDRFIVPLMIGIWKTDQKPALHKLIDTWISEGKLLFSSARFFEFNKELDKALIAKLFEQAKKQKDLFTVIQVTSVIAAHFEEGRKDLISELLLPAIKFLTTHKETRWTYGFWYRKQRSGIINSIDDVGYQILLDNLIWLKKIEYQPEEVLSKIAERAPERVIEFFCNRIKLEGERKNDDKFEPIPYEFHSLSAPLSKIPDIAVDAVFTTYDDKYGMFIFRGGRLLSNIFTQFSSGFSNKLLSYIQTGDRQKLLFVLAILRNYEGEEYIHPLCKEIIKVLPEEDDLIGEVEVALINMGVVGGEYGRAEALENRKKLIEGWKKDSNEKVRRFASQFVERIEQSIDVERQRAKEGIILRKHQYGEPTGE